MKSHQNDHAPQMSKKRRPLVLCLHGVKEWAEYYNREKLNNQGILCFTRTNLVGVKEPAEEFLTIDPKHLGNFGELHVLIRNVEKVFAPEGLYSGSVAKLIEQWDLNQVSFVWIDVRGDYISSVLSREDAMGFVYSYSRDLNVLSSLPENLEPNTLYVQLKTRDDGVKYMEYISLGSKKIPIEHRRISEPDLDNAKPPWTLKHLAHDPKDTKTIKLKACLEKIAKKRLQTNEDVCLISSFKYNFHKVPQKNFFFFTPHFNNRKHWFLGLFNIDTMKNAHFPFDPKGAEFFDEANPTQVPGTFSDLFSSSKVTPSQDNNTGSSAVQVRSAVLNENENSAILPLYTNRKRELEVDGKDFEGESKKQNLHCK